VPSSRAARQFFWLSVVGSGTPGDPFESEIRIVSQRSAKTAIVWFATCMLLGVALHARVQDNCAASANTESTCGAPNEKIPPEERQALIALYNATGGPQWKDNSGWLGEPGTECEWHGITCNYVEPRGVGRTVVVIGLGQNNLAGTIPLELGQLKNLWYLDLEENQLSGAMPPELGQLTNLSSLDLSENNLRGTIPPQLGQLTKLKWLTLFGNHFTGTLPEPLIQRWLAGPLWIAAETPLLTSIAKIDYEWNASSLLCARRRIVLSSDRTVVVYTTRCRNATPRDRTTYCEVKEGEITWQGFAALAWTIQNGGFFGLQAEYWRNVTDAEFANTRVTRAGTTKEVSNYASAGPLALWIMERAMEGVASDIEVKKTTRMAKCPRW